MLIERKIDTYIAYEFSKNYGHKNYLIPENFNNISKNKELISKFINDIHLEISHQYKNSNKMVVHYLDTYKYILGNVRNICAHDEKLYDIILKIMLEKEQFDEFYNLLIKNIELLKKELFTTSIV